MIYGSVTSARHYVYLAPADFSTGAEGYPRCRSMMRVMARTARCPYNHLRQSRASSVLISVRRRSSTCLVARICELDILVSLGVYPLALVRFLGGTMADRKNKGSLDEEFLCSLGWLVVQNIGQQKI